MYSKELGKWKWKSLSPVWLCDPMDYVQSMEFSTPEYYFPPGSSVHGDSPCKNTGVGSLSLLQGIFPIQGSNPSLPHYSLPAELQGKPLWFKELGRDYRNSTESDSKISLALCFP